MRVVVSNPDGMGDVVLRLPMMRAILDAGHELMVLCRGHAEHFVRRGLGPAAQVVVLQRDPYAMQREKIEQFDADLIDRVHPFLQSDGVLAFGPYQWTILEEHLARIAAESGGTRVRMNGFRYLGGRSVDGIPGAERVVEVHEHWHESRKNAALCAGVLGKQVALGDPVLRADETDLELARKYLAAEHPRWWARAGSTGFWTGLMGNAGDYYAGLKEWGHENWVDVVRHLITNRGLCVLLTGAENERKSLERIRSLIGLEEQVAVVTGDASTSEGVSMILGLTSLSQAYIGKDSGPMHVAAALGKPVVSLFGGGHWPRFTPLATPSLAVAVEMPCSPCGWFCRMSESYCVKLVPVSRVTAAIDAVADGSATSRCVELLPRT
ncbi:MAG TPA: glycosyltransferase family 9 protein [Phycisphaerae bacterium]|nr:glycosyltransferase family 9 protein [Phycisphaerae bacterium]